MVHFDEWLLIGPERRPYAPEVLQLPSELSRLKLPVGYLEALQHFGLGNFNGSCWFLPPAHLQTICDRLGNYPADFAARERLQAMWIVAQDDAGTLWAFEAACD